MQWQSMCGTSTMPLGLPDLGEFPKHQPRCHRGAQFSARRYTYEGLPKDSVGLSSGFPPCVNWSDKVDEAFVAVHFDSSVVFEMAPVSDNLAGERLARNSALRIRQPSVVSRAAVCRGCTCSRPTLRSSMLFARKRSRVLRAPGPKGAPRLLSLIPPPGRLYRGPPLQALPKGKFSSVSLACASCSCVAEGLAKCQTLHVARVVVNASGIDGLVACLGSAGKAGHERTQL